MSQTIVQTVSNAGNRLSLTSVDKAATSAEQEPSLYRYSHLLPSFDPNEPRALSHKDSRSFLANAVTNDLTPWFGTEISNVDLLTLNEEGRDQLALETARRGVLVFRDQEHWLNADTDAWVAFASYFGRLHIHPTSGHPRGYPQVHLVYRDAHATYNYELDQNITATVWHSDVSYEIQPPGLTIFFLLDQPKTGGDTLFVSQTAVLRRFSPAFVAFLRTLNAVHSGMSKPSIVAQGSEEGWFAEILWRMCIPYVQSHDGCHGRFNNLRVQVVRRHPVTGEEALYVNKQFTRRIVGLKKEESDNLLNFLCDALAQAHESQVRLKWRPNTVVVWDNRITAHAANLDFSPTGERRHGARLAAQAEKPIASSKGI
ncbi:hypothetical protein BS47DRAFT_1392998 [Hydnum rufescens UP504]|uniref:TauD/TfdA-like domain-containing protein n=1 Tax=Hydnum rufescens UP504 TaxID=1448309 RepID=A0A9P6AXG4_9AGAM|nr:hypothetical protein BS47DRAFT_1392998 [Hydnum rufescens UP504]